MSALPDIVPITDLRQDAAGVIKRAADSRGAGVHHPARPSGRRHGLGQGLRAHQSTSSRSCAPWRAARPRSRPG